MKPGGCCKIYLKYSFVAIKLVGCTYFNYDLITEKKKKEGTLA